MYFSRLLAHRASFPHHRVRCILPGVSPAGKPPAKTLVFLSTSEASELLGLSVNTVKSYILKGLFPPADAMIGRERGWYRKTVKDWNYNRQRPSRREPDPSMLKNGRDRRVRR